MPSTKVNESAHRAVATSVSGTRLVGAFTAAPAVIRQLGVDPATVLAAAGIDPALLGDPSNRIPYDGLARLLNEAAARTDCPHFGLLLGRLWHLPDMGLLGELARHAPTAGAALQELVVHQNLNSEGALGFVVQRGEVVDFGYSVYVPSAASMARVYDAVLAAGVNFMRDLCGNDWSPTAVFFSHSAPADVAPYRQYFQAPLHFDSDVCAIRFRARWLAQPVAGADPERLRLAHERARAVPDPTLVDRVHRNLRTLLLYGKASGADLAQLLAMHRRTLDRRLSAAGTTFHQVLDHVRFAVARELLEDSKIAMPDITAALGYADDVSFIRAFRRWTGTTPGAWREGAR